MNQLSINGSSKNLKPLESNISKRNTQKKTNASYKIQKLNNSNIIREKQKYNKLENIMFLTPQEGKIKPTKGFIKNLPKRTKFKKLITKINKINNKGNTLKINNKGNILKINNKGNTLKINNKGNTSKINNNGNTLKIKYDNKTYTKSFLSLMCKNSGLCITLNLFSNIIREYFDNYNFENAKEVKKLSSGANGFINLVIFEKPNNLNGYISCGIIKSSSQNGSDNLFYEWFVGKIFVNKLIHKYPCFLETYKLIKYITTTDRHGIYLPNVYNNMQAKYALDYLDYTFKKEQDNINSMDNIKITSDLINNTCDNSRTYAVLIQYIDKPISLESFLKECISNKSIYNITIELRFLLMQIFLPLSALKNVFTHNDLHVNNIMLYKIPDNSYIKMEYMYKGKKYIFNTNYIVKIIDYGRSYFHNEGILYNTLKNILNDFCKNNSNEDNNDNLESFFSIILNDINKTSDLYENLYIYGKLYFLIKDLINLQDMQKNINERESKFIYEKTNMMQNIIDIEEKKIKKEKEEILMKDAELYKYYTTNIFTLDEYNNFKDKLLHSMSININNNNKINVRKNTYNTYIDNLIYLLSNTNIYKKNLYKPSNIYRNIMDFIKEPKFNETINNNFIEKLKFILVRFNNDNNLNSSYKFFEKYIHPIYDKCEENGYNWFDKIKLKNWFISSLYGNISKDLWVIQRIYLLLGNKLSQMDEPSKELYLLLKKYSTNYYKSAKYKKFIDDNAIFGLYEPSKILNVETFADEICNLFNIKEKDIMDKNNAHIQNMKNMGSLFVNLDNYNEDFVFTSLTQIANMDRPP